MPRVGIPLTAALLAAVAAGSVLAAGGASAVLSQVRGEVALLPAAGAPTGPPARPLEMVAAGAALRLAAGAEAVVICADDHALRLTGPAEWEAGPGACASGRALAGRHLLPADAPARTGALVRREPAGRGALTRRRRHRQVPVLLARTARSAGRCWWAPPSRTSHGWR